MFTNYFKIAFRNLLRHKGFSIINIAGLAFGVTACLLIGLFVRDETSFDKFIPGGEKIYRLYYNVTGNEENSKIATTPPMFATTLQQNYPEVENTLRVLNNSSKELFEVGDKKIYADKGAFAEPTFFNFFPLVFKYGSAVKALDDPGSIVLSNKMSQTYFGNANPVGKEIRMQKQSYVVKGVFQDNPTFHLPMQYIIPLAATGLGAERMASWEWYGLTTYVKLKEGSDAEAVETKFQNYTRPFLKGEGPTYQPVFQPLHKIHLYSADFKYDIATRGNITYVKALTIIALFILLIACFNFVNLSTAKSLQRAKEVGVRKTIGANKRQLMLQFIGETILLVLISVLISVGITFLLLPLLNQFTEKHILFDLFSNPLIALVLIALTLVVGIVAGFYPALVLSRFQPVKVLKGSGVYTSTQGKVPWLRHGLVVIQFSLSVLLIISAIVVIRQVNYLHNKDLGFEKEQIMFFPMTGDMKKNYEAFKNELVQSPAISSASIGYGFPGDMFGDGQMTVAGKGDQKPVKATQLMIDHDYIKTLGLQLIAGRDFSKENKTDKDAAFIINETAVRDMGFNTPEQALGKTLFWPTWPNPDSFKIAQVIGVVKDFHYKSLYDKVEPAVLQIYPDAYWKVAVKLKTAEVDNALAHVKKTWNRFSPDYPLEYNFLDENFSQMYKADDKLKSLIWIFTAITIFVACMGLFGLITYAAHQRKKEIGIRKVLGASINGIALLLSKHFIKLVLLSLLIASPIAWYFMNGWLQDFAYRISIGWDIFILAGIIAVFIALLTVSFQAIKAALANPVKNLRTE